MRTTIAVLNKKDDLALPTIMEALKNAQSKQAMNFTVASSEKIVSHQNLDLLNTEGINSSIAMGCSFTDEAKQSYSFLQLDNVITIFEGAIYTSSVVPKEKYAQELTKKLPITEEQMQGLIKKNEGDYSAFMLRDEEITVARDAFGAQPLYYGENNELVVFASSRKVLWQLGIVEARSFPPGNLCLLTKSGLQFKPIKTFDYVEPVQMSMDAAAGKLQKLLEKSVEARIAGFEKMSVAFSGGLDSSLIAYIADKCGVKIDLIYVSLKNETETENAFDAAEKLGLPMQAHLFKDEDVENVLPKIVDLIEEANPVKAAIGVPVYWAAQRAREVGHSVLLAGQGADELFGGYQRYVNEYCVYGDKKVQQIMFNDVINIHENNLERDKKICLSLDVDLRLPFICFDLIEFALGLPVDLKFEQKQNSLRKLILRKVALNMGLPKLIADKPKKAVQYSTGINNAVKRIAQKNGQTVNEYISGLFRESTEKYSQ
ncbi:MAG: asparagine synthetase B [Nitrososphaerota archaeon]|jgi:asparagine synthase (glutamine-hydrolysing)|nr:asparagine synthetase B [Nitrososphaerota archaeon]